MKTEGKCHAQQLIHNSNDTEVLISFFPNIGFFLFTLPFNKTNLSIVSQPVRVGWKGCPCSISGKKKTQTFSWRPCNSDSLSKRAFSTASTSSNSTYANPFGCPALSVRMVTLLTVPHDWKCCCTSSGEHP
jgi:hypothetical protein